MTEERSIRLLDALEGRTDTLLEHLRQARESRLALQRRLAELEAANLALAEKSHQLVEERRKLEATRLELVEENRELDEQNRELEEHNRHLHDRLAKGPGENTFPRPARRSQGLSALMGRSATSAATSTDVGARLVGRSAEGTEAGANTPSPDKSGSYDAAAVTTNTAAAATAAATTDADVGARLVGRSAEATDAGAKSPDESGSYLEGPGEQDASPSPQSLLGEWYRRYGSAFFKGHTRPLKVGIHEELAELEPWPEKLVRRALACYVNLPRYLKAVREGAERIDLEGKPAGAVDAKAAEHARKKLDRLQAERRGKAQPGTPEGNDSRNDSGDDGREKNSRDDGRGKNSREATRKKAGLKRTGQTRESGTMPDVKAEHGSAGSPPAARSDAGEPAQAQPAKPKPRPAGEKRFVTMEEKLAALVAKHRQP